MKIALESEANHGGSQRGLGRRKAIFIANDSSGSEWDRKVHGLRNFDAPEKVKSPHP
jgi:hypothetical protein